MSIRGLLEKHGVDPGPVMVALGLEPDPLVAREYKIGIGITTRNRWETVAKTIEEIQRLTPGAYIVLVDDASDKPGPYETGGDLFVHRFSQNVGVARAKNKCLELLVDCDHIFLFDDDAYPSVADWWRPYVESVEPHLMYVFQEFAGRGAPKLNDCRVVGEINGTIGYSTPRGVMLYVERWVLDIAGGMDEAFGLWGYEHGDWSNRIYSFGLTSWRYGDVANSSALIYSLDEHVHEIGGHQRSLPRATRQEMVAANRALHDAQYNTAEFRPFREGRSVVLTSLLTGVPDPQRKTPMAADPALVAGLVKSLAGRDVVVFANEVEQVPGATVEKVPRPGNPYFDRWLYAYQYLRDHPEIRWVWCVDGTDVLCLTEPFGRMAPGIAYVGSEPSIKANTWMLAHHPQYAGYLEAKANETLLNAGLLGGDRETVMRFCHGMIREYHGYRGIGQEMKFDMGAFNVVAEEFTIVTGPSIHTVFKTMDHKNRDAIWAHK